jgi:exonuclease VII large subunit
MEDKAIELLVQMYNELQEFRKETNERFTKTNSRIIETNERLDRMNDRLTETNKHIDNTNERLNKMESIIENQIRLDIKKSLDGYHMLDEKLKEQDKRLDSIESKLGQDFEITITKGGKSEKTVL